jgi:hypothetical protein
MKIQIYSPKGGSGMPLYQYDHDPDNIRLAEIADRLNLVLDKDSLPYAQFYKGPEAVGYVIRPGVIGFIDEIQIPADLHLTLIKKKVG